MIGNLDPISVIAILGGLSLLPIVVLLTTSFLKISMVMILLRNAMGVQQVPPNIALYALSLILSAYVMAPVVKQITHDLGAPSAVTADAGAPMGSAGLAGQGGPPGSPGLAATPVQPMTVSRVISTVQRAATPMRDFMMRHSSAQERDFFLCTASSLWGPQQASGLAQDDFLVLVPAFMISQMASAFKIGFLLYLPFVIIDLIVSNILLAMGMMMVSPVTISMPLKLFLFVMVDGWTRLIHGLVLSYT